MEKEDKEEQAPEPEEVKNKEAKVTSPLFSDEVFEDDLELGNNDLDKLPV